VIRGGKVVKEVRVKGNTLTSAFLTWFRKELTGTYERYDMKQMNYIKLYSSSDVIGSATITSSDISYELSAHRVSVSKNVYVTASAFLTDVGIGNVDGETYTEITKLTLSTPLAVSSGDYVSVTYEGVFDASITNLSGLLSDADYTAEPLVWEIIRRLAQQTPQSVTIKKVELLDQYFVTQLSVDCQNDNSNYIIKIPETTLSTSITVKHIRLVNYSNNYMVQFSKASAVTLPAGSRVSLSIGVM